MTHYAIYHNSKESGIMGKNPPIIISKNKKLLEKRIENKKEFYIEQIKFLPKSEEICNKGQWYEQQDETYIFMNMKPISNKDLSELLSNS